MSNDPRFPNRGRYPSLPYPQLSTDQQGARSMLPNATVDAPGNADAPRVYVSDPQKFCQMALLNGVTTAGQSTLALSQPPQERTYFLVINLDAALDLWVNVNSSAAVDRGVVISPNRGSYELNNIIWQGDISVFSTGAAKFIMIQGSRADFGL